MKKGTFHTDETKAKIAEKHRGKSLSSEHRAKVIKTLVYGEKCKGSDNPFWKGGRSMHGGYVTIRIPDHPRAYSNGYVKRAILVAEEKIGRSLFDNEVTHHINGIKNDDSPENIEVLTAGQHNAITAHERWSSGDWVSRRKA